MEFLFFIIIIIFAGTIMLPMHRPSATHHNKNSHASRKP